MAVSDERIMTACIPIRFLSSCSGSEAKERKVTTSLAIWEEVAGVPSSYLMAGRGKKEKKKDENRTRILFGRGRKLTRRVHRKEHEPYRS